MSSRDAGREAALGAKRAAARGAERAAAQGAERVAEGVAGRVRRQSEEEQGQPSYEKTIPET